MKETYPGASGKYIFADAGLAVESLTTQAGYMVHGAEISRALVIGNTWRNMQVPHHLGF